MNSIPFVVPYIADQFVYDPGPQPNNPGVSVSPWKRFMNPATVKPWPRLVNTFGNFNSSPGMPRLRAVLPIVNNYSPLPTNFMFIGGFVQKSKG